MLARSDILVCLLPLTAATRGILNAALFAKLPRDGRLGGAVLLNAGRGGLQVEADIVAALETGALKGASLDVFETEPLPQDLPLWRHPAVFVTPHNAAMSHPEFRRPRHRRADPSPRARRAAAACGGSGQGVLGGQASLAVVIASKAKRSRLSRGAQTKVVRPRRLSKEVVVTVAQVWIASPCSR